MEKGKINIGALPKAVKEKYNFPESGQELYRLAIMRAFEAKREAFNLTEAFAASFTSGLGDEKAAYVAMGQAFCRIIKPYDKALAYFNHEGFYKNTNTLYTLWSKRLSKNKIIQEMAIADAETESARKALNKKQEALEKIKKEIVSIDTDGEPIQARPA